MQLQLFSWIFPPKTDDVRSTAKDRMRSMLTHDRLELPAGRLETLEEELMAVVGRYFELDKDTTHFDLQQYERRGIFIANFRLILSKC